MGNKTTFDSKALDSGLFSEQYENKSGKILLQAIRANNLERALKAINKARSEFILPTKSTSNEAEYEVMVHSMLQYLTRQYNIGDGVVFTKSPLEYCDICDSSEVKDLIQKEIDKYLDAEKRLDDRPRDRVTAERAKIAKAKLQAFQETRKK